VLEPTEDLAADETPVYLVRGKTFLGRMQHMPPLHEEGLWSAKIKTIRNLGHPLRQNRQRTLFQMAAVLG
jgi:type I restriction enzyme R subunit